MALTPKQKRVVKNNLIGYSFILPNFIGYFLFIFIPVVFSFVLSVMKWNGSANTPMEFVGFDNFVRLMGDSTFKMSVGHTFYYAVFTVPLTVAAALLIAVLLNSKIKGIVVYRTAFFFPYIASLVAVGAVWNMLFMKDVGPINGICEMGHACHYYCQCMEIHGLLHDCISGSFAGDFQRTL